MTHDTHDARETDELTAPTWDEAMREGEIVDRSGHHDPNPEYRARAPSRQSCGCEAMTDGGYAYRDVTVAMPDGRTVYFYHQSPVVVERAGVYRLDSCGWQTMTTKERINRHAPRGYTVRQEDFEWYLERPDGPRVDFVPGMTVRA